MESCGLQYQFISPHALSEEVLVIVSASLALRKGNFNTSMTYGGASSSFKKGRYSSAGAGLEDASSGALLVLEPNLELLVAYHDYTIAASSSTGATTRGVIEAGLGAMAKRDLARSSKALLLQTHSIFPQEIRQMILTEQRKYSIQRKVSQFIQLSSRIISTTAHCSYHYPIGGEDERSLYTTPSEFSRGE